MRVVTKQQERQELPDYLDVDDVAKRYRSTPGTVRYWRHIGYGPKSIKLGARVIYPRESIEAFDAWLKSQLKDASGSAA